MFDEESKEPEDVFAQTDASAPQMTPPTMNEPVLQGQAQGQPLQTSSIAPQPPVAAQMSAQETVQKRPFPWKLVILFVAIVAVIGLAFFLSMRILNSRTPVTPEAPAETTQPAAQTSTPEGQAQGQPLQTTPVEQTTPAPAVEETLDTDKDGLIDVREAQLGTNPNNPDTDADGLFDKEEVDVYQTNPLNPDTDGDTFTDGAEVKNGYNPAGPGKLLQVPQK